MGHDGSHVFVFDVIPRTTDPNGQVQTQTVRSTQLVFPSSTSGGGGGGSSSNTAAIAGGVVGGAVGILALIMIVFFLLRRHKRTDEFDGNFDPDRLDPERLGGNATRPGTMPHVDLVGAEVTPYQYSSDAAPQKGYQQYPQMAQQQRPGTAPVMGGAGYATSDARSSTTGSHYPTTITDPSGMRPDFRGPSPGVSLGTSGTLPSSKGRESTSEGGVLRVANDENGEGGSGGGIMFQHRDAGRIPEEVPPSYDSISPDERSAAGTSQVSQLSDLPRRDADHRFPSGQELARSGRLRLLFTTTASPGDPHPRKQVAIFMSHDFSLTPCTIILFDPRS